MATGDDTVPAKVSMPPPPPRRQPPGRESTALPVEESLRSESISNPSDVLVDTAKGNVKDSAAAPAAPTASAVSESIKTGPPYVLPSWASTAAPGCKFQLEVVKDGIVLGRLDVFEKSAYMFGRSDRSDFVLEHPSVSRFHAVLQFGPENKSFLCDLGSTHGSFINKQRVKAQVHVPVRVGDIIKFGNSTRLYIFQGPEELMPEEGLSRAQRRALRQAEASLRLKEKATVEPESQGISWGMADDASDEEEDDANGDLQLYQTYKGKLTELQAKMMEKLNKRQEKMGNMQREIQAIQNKETAQGGLTDGQQNQIARNEQRMLTLSEEIENLEESLNESIEESLHARNGKYTKRRKKNKAEEEEEEEYHSDEDEFYDRVGRRSKSVAGIQKVDGAGGAPRVETAQTLLAQRDDLVLEIQRLRDQGIHAEQQKAVEISNTDSSAVNEEEFDPLDEFMQNMSTQIKEEKIVSVEQQIAQVEASLERVNRLLRIADPGGEATARWAGKSVDAGAVALITMHQAAPPVGVEVEQAAEGMHEKVTVQNMALPVKGSVGIIKVKAEVGEVTGGIQAEQQPIEGTVDVKEGVTTVKEESDRLSSVREGTVEDKNVSAKVEEAVAEKVDVAITAVSVSADGVAGGGEVKEEAGAKVETKQKHPGKRGKGRSKSGLPKKRKLGPGRPPPQLNEEDVGEVDTWVPPSGQTGDGRTALNEKLGY